MTPLQMATDAIQTVALLYLGYRSARWGRTRLRRKDDQ